MASKSLGTLTLDLIAKIGGFTQGMDKASRESAKRAKEIERQWKKAGDTIKTAFAALAVGATIKQFIDNTAEAERVQAQLAAVIKSTGGAAGKTQEQFNDAALEMARASTFSVEEITKAQTTLSAFSGIQGKQFDRAMQAAADMAARTGMDIAQTAELVGRALDVPSAGMTALSKQGFRFSEAQKEIVKHLESTGSTAEAHSIVLDAMQESYGGAAKAARDTFSGAQAAVKNALDDLMTGSGGNLPEATAALNDLADVLSDPNFKESTEQLAVAALKLVKLAAEGATEFARFGDVLARWAASITGNISEVDKIKGSIKDVDAALNNSFFGKPTKYLFKSNEELQAIRAEMVKTLEALGGIDEKTSGGSAAIRSATLDQDAELAAARAAAAREEQAKQAKKDYEARRKAIESDLDGLQRELDLWGKTNDEIKIYDLLKKGATDADVKRASILLGQLDILRKQKEEETAFNAAREAVKGDLDGLQRELDLWGKKNTEAKLYEMRMKGALPDEIKRAELMLNQLDALKEQQKIQDAYTALTKSLRTEDERRLDTLKEQLETIRKAKDIAPEERSDMRGRAIGAAFTSDMPKFAGVGEMAGGFSGEFQRLDAAESELADWYRKKLDMLTEARQAEQDANNEFDEQELALKQRHSDALAAIDQARQTATLNQVSDFLGNLSALQNSENSKARAIGKAAAIAQATIKTYEMANNAYASASAVPVIGHILGPIAAGAAIAAGMANVAAIKGMAHDGIENVPQTGTWLLEKGERVTTAKTSAKLDSVLDEIRSGGSAANDRGVRIVNNFTLQTPADTRTQNQVAALAGAAIQRAMARNA